MSIKNITEEMLVEASLDGFPCKGYAWTEVTRVEVLEPGGKKKVVDGVRTWRGKAVITRGVFPLDRLFGNALIYKGPLEDGDQTRDITGYVYISNVQGAKPVHSGGDGMAPPKNRPGDKLYIEFAGASNPKSLFS